MKKKITQIIAILIASLWFLSCSSNSSSSNSSSTNSSSSSNSLWKGKFIGIWDFQSRDLTGNYIVNRRLRIFKKDDSETCFIEPVFVGDMAAEEGALFFLPHIFDIYERRPQNIDVISFLTKPLEYHHDCLWWYKANGDLRLQITELGKDTITNGDRLCLAVYQSNDDNNPAYYVLHRKEKEREKEEEKLMFEADSIAEFNAKALIMIKPANSGAINIDKTKEKADSVDAYHASELD